MLDSIYVGLTGLSGFSDGLRTISNNVANVNTPGFKGSELQFEDLFYRFQAGTNNGGQQADMFLGSGIKTGGTTILFSQGELRQTGNDLDAAVEGNGFFVVRQDGNTFYTRDGQFEFDANGYLVARGTTGRVAALVNGQLQDINIDGNRVNPPKATTTVKLSGNLSVNDSDGIQVISNLTVHDAIGGTSTLKVTFTNNSSVTPRSWTIKVEDAAGNLVDNTGEFRFQGDGSPQTGYNTHTFTYTPTGAPALSITLDAGVAGGFSGATNFSGGTDSTLAVASQDGYASGSITKTAFDTDGTLVLTYSNGQTTRLAPLALAWFNFLQGLTPAGQSRFENNADLKVQLGTAQTSLFGKVTGGSIEGANVDMGQEFANLIIVQRGYQASSQVVSASNEMIQQLLDISGKR